MTVGEFCNRDTIVIGKDESVVAAAKLMRDFHVGSVVVVEEMESGNKPVGIVTDRDLALEILATEVDPSQVSIGDVMSYELTTAGEHEDLWDCLQRMRSKGIRRMPVVNEGGVLVGILSSDDLLELLADQFGQLVKIVSKEREREERVRSPLS